MSGAGSLYPVDMLANFSVAVEAAREELCAKNDEGTEFSGGGSWLVGSPCEFATAFLELMADPEAVLEKTRNEN